MGAVIQGALLGAAGGGIVGGVGAVSSDVAAAAAGYRVLEAGASGKNATFALLGGAAAGAGGGAVECYILSDHNKSTLHNLLLHLPSVFSLHMPSVQSWSRECCTRRQNQRIPVRSKFKLSRIRKREAEYHVRLLPDCITLFREIRRKKRYQWFQEDGDHMNSQPLSPSSKLDTR